MNVWQIVLLYVRTMKTGENKIWNKHVKAAAAAPQINYKDAKKL